MPKQCVKLIILNNKDTRTMSMGMPTGDVSKIRVRNKKHKSITPCFGMLHTLKSNEVGALEAYLGLPQTSKVFVTLVNS